MLKKSFTLVELVVILITAFVFLYLLIVVLKSPHPHRNALRKACALNLREVTTGLAFYLSAFKDTYATTGDFGYDGDRDGNAADLRWMNLVGKKGTWKKNTYGAQADERDRLLNEFLNDTGMPIAECPLDNGDFFGDDDSTAFAGYGSSYVYHNRTPSEVAIGMKRAWDGIWVIEGHKGQEIRDTTRKLVVADMMILTDRTVTAERNQWHRKGDPGKVSMGFADGHVKEMPRKTRTGSAGMRATPHAVDIDDTEADAMSQTAYY